MLASLAGGGFFMLQPASQRARVIDAFVQTPTHLRPQAELDIETVELDFGGSTQAFNIGRGTVAVPGMVRGAFSLNAELGHIPLKELVNVSLETGRQPVRVNDCQARIFKTLTPVCLTRTSAAQYFSSPDDSQNPVGAGDALEISPLADTLDVLANEGEDFFYRGEIAAMFESQAKHEGGSIGLKDLERYETKIREVETVALADASVALTPAPSAGGVLLGFGLAMAAASDSLQPDTPVIDKLQTLVNIMQATGRARIECTDPDGYDWPDVTRLLAETYIARWQQQLADRARAWRGTTHLSVIDHDGNIASLSTSNGAGCGEILGATGIMPNNMLGEEDLSPRGLFNWEPDQRMSSMMTRGSNRIRTAMLQVIVNLELLAMPLEQAVNQSRIHVEDDTLWLEGGWPESVVAQFTECFPDAHCFDDISFYFGGVHAASQGPAGVDGSGDARRGGCAVVIPQ